MLLLCMYFLDFLDLSTKCTVLIPEILNQEVQHSPCIRYIFYGGSMKQTLCILKFTRFFTKEKKTKIECRPPI